MAIEATINARLPESLKAAGTAVLERNGVSPTQLVRSVYRYMEQEQKLPECLDVCADAKARDRLAKLQLARSIAGAIDISEPFDAKRMRGERVQQKYGELL